MMHKRRRNFWISWLPALSLAGCGGGGSGGVETLPPVDVSTPPGMVVTGQVTKAPLDSAAIALLPIDAFGAVSGAAVATTTTQADGSFTAVIPQAAGALLIRTSGGSYTDEADREPDPALKRRISLNAGEGLESLLPDGVSTVAVSIVTQALLDKARRETVAGTFLQQFAANRALATQAFGFDIVTTLPANPISPDPALTVAQRQYAMLLGGLANLVNRVTLDAGLAEPDIGSIQAVVADFSDGRIDGLVAGAPVMVNAMQAGAFSINEEIARFRNNNFNAYANTPLLVVDEDVFSQIPSPANSTPVAADDNFQIDRGDALSITAPGVLENDSDADGNPLTATLVTAPGNSLAFSLQDDGSFSYQHDGGAPGIVTFEYLASDGLADSNVATVTIDVVNSPPVANDDMATTGRGGTTTMLDSGDALVLSNDTDADGDALTARLVDPPLNGQLTLSADGTFSYTHDGGTSDSDSFTYFADDGIADSNVATVTIDVVNSPPVANDDMVTTGRGGTTTMLDSGDGSLLSNDTDANGDALTAQLVDPPLNGQLTLNTDGTFSYTHDGGTSGSDSFTYFANDGIADSNTATVGISIDNTPPVAVADCIVVAEGASVSVVNGVCPTPRPLARSSADKRPRLLRPTRGPDFFTGFSGTLQFVSPPPDVAPGMFQNDVTLPVFLEQIMFGLSRPAVVNLTEPDVYGPGGNDGSNTGGCLPVNSFISSALIHGDNSGIPNWNGGFTLDQPLIGLITESQDLDASDLLMGDPSVFYDSGAEPTRGLELSALPVGDDMLTIEPDRLAVSGIDFAPPFLVDPLLDVARIVVSPPLFAELSVTGSLGTQVMLTEPRQIDKDPMPPVIVAPEGRPLRIVDRRRAVISVAAPGPQTFIVSGAQTNFGSADAVVPGQPVQLVIDGPVMNLTIAEAGDYEFVVSLPELSLVVNGPLAPGLLSNDTDADLDALTFMEITAQPASGTVSIEPDGTFVYTHDGSESVSDSFGYRISDGVDTDDGAVTVTVLPVDDPPVAADDVMLPIDEGGNVSTLAGGATSVLDNDFDAEADSNTAQLLDPPSSAGMFTLSNDGTFFYEHDGSPTISDEFTYVVESAFTGSCMARVMVSITPINDPPTTTGIANVNDPISAGGRIIDLYAAFDDEEDPDDALLFEVVGNTNPGIFISVSVLDGDLELLYEAPGSSTLTIRATDTGGLFVDTSFIVTIQSSQAAVFDVSGDVSSATGAFAALIPPGTLIEGPAVFDAGAVAMGFAGPGDIISLDINVGGFCFSTQVPSQCPNGGADVPITSIDSAALTFTPGQDAGGTLDVTAFSPTFQVSIPIMFDFDAGTFFADGAALGTVGGTATLSPR